jgi:serine/threonine-protein kinase
MATNIPKKLGKYDVLDVIGRGGMGVVYKAIDPGIGRLVAIKMMTAGFTDDPDLLKRFYREAQSAGKLQHPNIVTIYDLGDQDGNPYMVMQFLEGESLDLIIGSRRPIPLEQKLDTVIQVCNGLNYAHQHNVIHRDIKPANVMVLKDLTVKIVDFGIARIGNENVTRPGQLMGSVPYMSPEQIKDKAYVDSRTDIFSVGVLLYQLLTNALPFDGKDMGAILLKIIHDPPPPLQTYLPAYPAELDGIIARALAKNQEERYATADHLAFDLIRVQEELKRDMVVEYLKSVDNLMAESQWNQAKEQVLQILRIDRQNSRASELLRKVEQQMLTQKRSEQARELRVQAEQAIAREELGDALRYLENAVELDSGSHELRQLRDSIAERKTRADKLAALLQRAESARDAGELEEAQKAVAEALLLERDNREAQALNDIITREIAEHNKLKQVQGLLDEARKRIASRSFTAALEVLKKADMLAPAAPGIRELANLATSGQEQERRRKQLESFNAEIEDALSRDNFVLACARADEGLQVFPEDRGLLKLKKLAEKQRQASEKRAYVEGQVAAARQLLDSADPDQSLIPLQEALKRYPQEPALISMLSVVKESLARRREEQRKADCIQRAKDAIRRKAYTEAIETLEATRKEIPSSDLDDLLQFAQEEAATHATRQKINAVADQARQFISAEEYQSAIDLLAATLAEVDDEDLSIILEDARRRLQEFDHRVQEAVDTAERLLRNDRYSEAVRFLEAQFEQCGKAPKFAALLEQARHDLNRVESFSITRENTREALSKDDFTDAVAILQQFREKFGETQDARILQREIEGTRSRAATAAMEKALPDVRMLLMVRSFESAEGILDSLSQWGSYAPPVLKEQYEALREVAMRAKAQRASSELAEKLIQARVSDEPTAAMSPESEAASVGIGSTDAMSRGQLEDILGEVVQIGDHYQDNEKVQSAIQDFKRLLTLRIGELEEKREPTPTELGSLPQESPETHSVAPPAPVAESDLSLTEQYADSAPPEAVDIPEESAGIEAAEALRESEQETEREVLRQQTEVRNVIQQAQDLLNRGQTTPAIWILQQAAAQHPGQSEIDDLLIVAESRARERQIVEIDRQAGAQAKQGQFDQALSTLEEGLKQFPEAEILAKARESVSAARQRVERLAEARRLRDDGEFPQALELVETGLQGSPNDPELTALKRQIESDQAKHRRQEAIAQATQEAQQHLRDGQTARAIDALQRCSKQFPDDESVSKLLRTAEERLRIETEQAKRQRQEAIAKATEKAQKHLRDGKTARAIEVLQRCSTQFPDDEISKLLRAAEAQLRTELELNSIRTQAETLVREGREEEAVGLLEKSLPKYTIFEELLATARSKLNAKRREELLSRAVQFQRQVRYGEAHELVQQAIWRYGSTPVAADLERTLHDQIEAERRQKSHDADRDKLLAIEQQVPTTRQSKLTKLAVRAQQIADPYAADEEVAAIALRIRQRIASELSATAPRKPIPVREIAAGAASILAVVAGIIVVPRLFRVTTIPVEIRTDPPGASVHIGERSCLTPNCRLDLKPGQYQIEARLDGYRPFEQSLTVDSAKQIAPINLMMQPVPPPPQSPGAKSAATGTLVVQSGLPDALVSVDSVLRGRTDGHGVFSMQLEAKSHQVRVEKPGYQTPAEQQVDIASAASRRLTFSLDPLRSEAKSEPRLKAKSEEQSRQAVEDKTKNADKLRHDQLLADLQNAARQDLSRSDFTSARQKADQIKAAGGSSGTLLTEIEQAEAQASRAVQYENSYQQAFQRYRQAAASNDRSGLEEARKSFQSIAQQAGSHAADAQKYSQDIDKRLVALNQPPPNTAPQPTTPAQPTTPHSQPEKPLRSSVDESAAVGNVIKKYEQAFDDKNVDELRQIWPDIGQKYADYKKAFENAQAQHVEVVNQTVKISDNGEQATVTGSLINSYTPKGSKMMKRTDRVQFELIKQNGTWVIRNVQ